ncbi:MAG: hypothetical protein CM1200mP41_17510 [Gammaproteobacteria bacterium]|nr:MAG: hypothetical protein CM1200mP41_17510 [Gammaproteobacteria bacterium]
MLLQDLQREFGMAVLLITHDLGVVRRVADRMYVMRPVASSSLVIAIRYSTTQQAYTRTLIDAEPPDGNRADDTAASCFEARTSQLVSHQTWAAASHRGHVKAANGITVLIRAGHTMALGRKWIR